MAEGHDRDCWNHTSALLAMLINTRLGATGKIFKPNELNPMHMKKQPLPKIKAEKIAEFFKAN